MTDIGRDGHLQAIASLTPKQVEVLELVVDRRTNKEISGILNISPSAVEQRLQSVRQKFGVQSRADLARAYEQLQGTYGTHVGVKNQVDPSGGDPHAEHANGEEITDLGECRANGRNTVSNLGRRREDLLTKSAPAYDRLTVLAIRVAALAVTVMAFALLACIVLKISQFAR